MRANSPKAVGRRRRKEEEPPPLLATRLGQLLQVQHLTKRHPPQRQNILMQMVILVRGPGLKCRRISRDRREIRIMQPIENLVLLTQACIPLPVLTVLATPMPQRRLRALLAALAVKCLFPATTNEQHVTNADIAALRCGPDVDSLVESAAVQVLPGDGVVVERVVINTLLVRVAAVVKQHAAAGDPVLGPVVNRTFVVSSWAGDVAAFCL
jgi:hypothetical protein